MTTDQLLAATALDAWKKEIDRASKAFSALTDAQLTTAIAPGKNRLVYLWGHLIAVNDRMLPLLGIGPQRHPELDAPFLLGADSALTTWPSATELKRWWDEGNQELLTAFDAWAPEDWVKPHTAVAADAFAANPLRNRLAVVISRTAHISYHLGQAALAPQ